MPDRQLPTNAEIAEVLDQIAELLEVKRENRFRVQAYRDGATTIRNTEKDIARLVEQGETEDVTSLPNIGEGLLTTIREFVVMGRSDQLEDLRGEISPADLFESVPGIGPKMAERIAEELDIHSLEELEMAAHDGRLEQVEGFGPERVRSVKAALAGILSRSAVQRQRMAVSGGEPAGDRPSVELLLEIDRVYREKAEAGELEQIAPERFNPEGEAWLPIMNGVREGWTFTALYSNTKLAHDLDRTRDWVVIYCERREGGPRQQATVVTETQGPLKGRRVVRGREEETRKLYGVEKE